MIKLIDNSKCEYIYVVNFGKIVEKDVSLPSKTAILLTLGKMTKPFCSRLIAALRPVNRVELKYRDDEDNSSEPTKGT